MNKAMSKKKRILSAVTAVVISFGLIFGGVANRKARAEAADDADNGGTMFEAAEVAINTAGEKSDESVKADFADELLQNSMEWIDAYYTFLKDEQYLSTGQEYGTDSELTGLLFDMDHDGVPELLLDNCKTGNATGFCYVYSYVGGKVEYMGNASRYLYVDYDKGYKGQLYGLAGEMEYFIRKYTKNGNTITSEVLEEYGAITNDVPRKWFCWIGRKNPEWLLSELKVYRSLVENGFDDPAAEAAVMDDLLGGLGWLWEDYDCGNIKTDYFLMDLSTGLLTNLRFYPGNIIENDPYDYTSNSGKNDPKGKFNTGFFQIDGEGTDWVLKNIYNVSDGTVEGLHDNESYSHYYYNSDYYTSSGGVGGGFDAYLNDIEIIDGVYHVSYTEACIADGPGDIIYTQKYALMEYKIIDGRGWWSVYKTSEEPIDEVAVYIGSQDAVTWSGTYRYNDDETIIVKEVKENSVIIVQSGLAADGESCYETEKELIFTDSSKSTAYEIFQDGKSKVYYKMKSDRITVEYPEGWWEDRDYIKVDDEEKIEFSDRYAPYPIIALKSRSNGCYVTCDIGVKGSDGKYQHYDEPELHMDATKIDSYEMFELVRCTDGSYALRSIMNRQFLTKNKSGAFETGFGTLIHSYVYNDFIDDDTKLELDLSSKYTKIKFKNSNNWMSYDSGFLEPNSNESKAEEFEIVFVKNGGYEDWEKGIITSQEWFNIDGKGKGYWDIQNDIGTGSTEALETLGYTPMHLKGDNKKTIENHQMQCSVGVKVEDGFYDVVIAFQGTGGYSDDTWDWVNNIEDVAMSLLNVFNFDASGHDGYIAMVGLFIQKQNDIVATLNGNEIRYTDLLDKASKHQARFTILGHSMGGAMAQIYACVLLGSNIDRSQIRGRTFNAALALTQDDNGEIFDDWINLCVSTDTVTNGLVPGSINCYGIHRIGKTIWLYDNEPDKDTGGAANISEPKHNMDRKLLEILQACYATGGQYKVQSIANDSIPVTNRDDVKIYEEPYSSSEQIAGVLKKNTGLEIAGYTYNKYGNKWYQLGDGGYVYSNNVALLKLKSIKSVDGLEVFSFEDDVPVRKWFDKDADVVGYLNKGQIVDIKYAVRNLKGNYWFYIGNGWVYSSNLALHDRTTGNYKRLRFDCPVDVELYDSNDKLIARISNDGTIETTDPDKVIPYMVGEAKFFDIGGDEEYNVKINSLFYGRMEYEILSDYDENIGDFTKRKHFDGVDLEKDMKFKSTVGGDINADDITLKVVDDVGNTIREIAPSEYVEEDDLPPDNSSADKKNLDNGTKDCGGNTWMIIVIIAVVVLTVIIVILLLLRGKRRRLQRRDTANAGALNTASQTSQAQMIEYPRMNQARQSEQQIQPVSQQPVEQYQATPQQRFNTRFCANCGSPLDSEQLYCGACGTKRL